MSHVWATLPASGYPANSKLHSLRVSSSNAVFDFGLDVLGSVRTRMSLSVVQGTAECDEQGSDGGRRWAQLEAGPEEPEQDSQVHKMAMNVGRRPSIEDGTDMTVEVHILHDFQSFNFRGKHLRVVGTGYIRSGTSCNVQNEVSSLKRQRICKT